MDYLQYYALCDIVNQILICFKPYYKWITFNMENKEFKINWMGGFKPYYKWITFNIK